MFWGIVLICLMIFRRQQIKAYFVKKFGEGVFPKNNRYLFYGFAFGALSGIVGSFFDLQGKDRKSDSDEIIAIACIIAVACIFIAAVLMMFKRNKTQGFWGRFIINSVFWAGAFFPGVLIGTLFMWGGVIILLGSLGYFGLNGFAFGGGAGATSEDSNVNYRCCASCTRYMDGQCADNPGVVIDKYNTKCDGYVPS